VALAVFRSSASSIHAYLGGEGSLPAPVTPSSVPMVAR
jgi:glutamate synthase (NADPH) small chain